jgi:hypothetical protein
MDGNTAPDIPPLHKPWTVTVKKIKWSTHQYNFIWANLVPTGNYPSKFNQLTSAFHTWMAWPIEQDVNEYKQDMAYIHITVKYSLQTNTRFKLRLRGEVPLFNMVFTNVLAHTLLCLQVWTTIRSYQSIHQLFSLLKKQTSLIKLLSAYQEIPLTIHTLIYTYNILIYLPSISTKVSKSISCSDFLVTWNSSSYTWPPEYFW